MPRIDDEIDRKKRRSRRLHTTNILVVQTSWLDGAIKWMPDGIVWENDGVRTKLDAAAISSAQRRLNKIKENADAAKKLVGDRDAFWKRRI